MRWLERACCTGAEKMEPSEYYPELLVLTDRFSHHTIRRYFILVTSFRGNMRKCHRQRVGITFIFSTIIVSYRYKLLRYKAAVKYSAIAYGSLESV